MNVVVTFLKIILRDFPINNQFAVRLKLESVSFYNVK